MNNFRAFNKKTVIQGLESDSQYSSDFDDQQQIAQEQNNFSNPIINNQNSLETHEKSINAEDNQFDGCSKETVVLLKTRMQFDNPVKRLLSIWPSLYM